MTFNTKASSLVNSLIASGQIHPEKKADYQAVFEFAEGLGAIDLLSEDLAQLPARHLRGVSANSADLHQQITKRCRDMGKNPSDPNDYAEVMSAMNIDF